MLKSIFLSSLFFVTVLSFAQTPFDPEAESDFVKATYSKGSLPTILSQDLTYPQSAAINGTEGNVVYVLKIDESGKLASVEPKERVSEALSAQSEKKIAELTGAWTPTKVHGKAVDREYLLVFSYQINYNSLPMDYHAVAEKFGEKGKIDKAVKTYDQAIEKNPFEPNFYAMRAKYKKELGDEDGSESDKLMALKMTMEVLAIVEIGQTQSLR